MHVRTWGPLSVPKKVRPRYSRILHMVLGMTDKLLDMASYSINVYARTCTGIFISLFQPYLPISVMVHIHSPELFESYHFYYLIRLVQFEGKIFTVLGIPQISLVPEGFLLQDVMRVRKTLSSHRGMLETTPFDVFTQMVKSGSSWMNRSEVTNV